MAEPVTEEHLRKNMRHWELRFDRMLFAEYPWAERRLYWLNDGGSHHCGAARYQACRLGITVPLTGRLCRYGVNVPMLSVLRQQWHLFAIPTDVVDRLYYSGCYNMPSQFLNITRYTSDTSTPADGLHWLLRRR